MSVHFLSFFQFSWTLDLLPAAFSALASESSQTISPLAIPFTHNNYSGDHPLSLSWVASASSPNPRYTPTRTRSIRHRLGATTGRPAADREPIYSDKWTLRDSTLANISYRTFSAWFHSLNGTFYEAHEDGGHMIFGCEQSSGPSSNKTHPKLFPEASNPPG